MFCGLLSFGSKAYWLLFYFPAKLYRYLSLEFHRCESLPCRQGETQIPLGELKEVGIHQWPLHPFDHIPPPLPLLLSLTPLFPFLLPGPLVLSCWLQLLYLIPLLHSSTPEPPAPLHCLSSGSLQYCCTHPRHPALMGAPPAGHTPAEHPAVHPQQTHDSLNCTLSSWQVPTSSCDRTAHRL